ncbi:MAG: VWA domain-containing protein, partial [Pedobacter sp.]
MTTTDTEIICILDRSGSMADLASAAITGLNLFIQEQRELEGNCCFTLVQFNQESEVVIARKPLSEVTLLGNKHFIPSGYTALLDAIGQTLQTAEGLLADIPAENHPARVIVHIITDGQENCSKSFSHAEIRQMIARLEATEKWTFSFSGANMDSFKA